jgi:spore maturation protein CgeB
MDRLPRIPEGYKYDVSFWAVETDEIRIRALDLLEDRYDCRQNGTVRKQKFSKYKRKGAFYLQELSQCRIVLNFRGGGWDTMRYWEVPAVGAFMMTQKPGILIPDDFVEDRDVVYCSNDLSDLIDKCDYYLQHESEREAITRSGRQHLLKYHTDVARAEYLLDKLSALR